MTKNIRQIEVTNKNLIDEESGLKYGIVFNTVAVREDGCVKYLYKINNRVKTIWNTGTITNNNYLRIAINKKAYYIHRLVAEVFIPKRESCNFINHKDYNTFNNNIINLEWVNNQENLIHGHQNKIKKQKKLKKGYKGRHIKGTNVLTGEIIIFKGGCTSEKKELGLHMSAITQCCRGKLKTHKGYKWEYID